MHKFEDILNFVKEKRGFDFSGLREQMLERRIQKRVTSTFCKDFDVYFTFLCQQPAEIDKLIDVLTINVSHFFRDALTFEYLREIVIPKIVFEKVKENTKSLRIWSAGCSFGEEPYSIVLLLNEILNKEAIEIQLNIFATDIDKKALQKAEEGSYGLNSLENVKSGILNKYFTQKEAQFKISDEIKEMVHFSFYDMLDKKSYVPNDSIFGGFDIVLCRNVLIYFNSDYQERIFNKLYKSLNNGGILILGKAETPIKSYKHKFKRESNCCKIYRKSG